MKQKISISIEEDAVRTLDNIVKEGIFRNKSHVIEYALNKFLNGDKNDKN